MIGITQVLKWCKMTEIMSGGSGGEYGKICPGTNLYTTTLNGIQQATNLQPGHRCLSWTNNVAKHFYFINRPIDNKRAQTVHVTGY